MPPLTRSRERARGDGDGCRSRKRKKRLPFPADSDRKLLVGDEVEVRFMEEGLRGSWNPGVVIKCGRCVRFVRYYEMLEEGGAAQLVETISVSAAIEGLTKDETANHRGCIRPLPPHHKVETLDRTYGMCVDALFNDAWWEGVIMDREEGSETRLVFFPDLGDQHVISTEKMRVTFDWNEVSGEWKCRGGWVLFDLGEFPISIRQVWYLLSGNVAFQQKIGDWIFGSRSTWQEFVSEIVEEALSISCGQGSGKETLSTQSDDCLALVNVEVGEPYCSPGKDSALLTATDQNDSCRRTFHGLNTKKHLYPTTGMVDNMEIPAIRTDAPSQPSYDQSIPEEGLHAIMYVIDKFHKRINLRSCADIKRLKNARKVAKEYLLATGWEIRVGPWYKSYISPTGERCTFIKACEKWAAFKMSKRESTTEIMVPMQHTTMNENFANISNEECTKQNDPCSWKLDNIIGEYCPTAISNYRLKDADTALKVKKHLVALGWTIQHKFEKKAGRVLHRFRYRTPDGNYLYSLRGICNNLTKEHKVKDHVGGGGDDRNTDYPTFKYQYRQKSPKPILDYVHCMEITKLKKFSTISIKEIRQKRLKAKSHLQNSGWTIWYTQTRGKKELRYSSPKNRCFSSLLKACKSYLKGINENVKANYDASVAEGISMNKKTSLGCGRSKSCISTDLTCKHYQDDVCQSNDANEIHSSFFSNTSEFDEEKFCQLQQGRGKKANKRTKDASFSSSFVDLNGKIRTCPSDYEQSQHSRKRKVAQPLVKYGHRSRTRVSKHVLLPRIQARRDIASFTGSHRPKTILSMLIDNNVLQPMLKVRYLNKRDKRVMMEGWITREGIKCCCCENLFTLSKFEEHSGSTNHRPSANIFLEDGRSLSECQKQMIQSSKHNPFPHRRVKCNFSDCLSDGICSICQDGGTLVLCDHCPSSFHLHCVGLKEVPEGNWFCPSCKCSICGSSEFNSDTTKFMEDTMLYCDQCEREVHVGCLRTNDIRELKSCPEGLWFCSDICSKIFHHLHELIGKPNPTSMDGYSWSLLRSRKEIDNDFDNLDLETKAEHHSKLQVALDVFHECFVSIIEPRTGSDIIADLLYNKETELKRLNFWGFYTMVLEKEDEIVSVASFRVYGERAAEMPLIGTRIQYRRQGLCRLLIGELEKLLFSFGVEKLLLPAVPELLETWTNSFGFSRMSHAERMMLSEYMFLCFQGTTMCQKSISLPKLCNTAANNSGEYKQQKSDAAVSNNKMDYEDRAIIPEVLPIDELQSAATETCLRGEDVTLTKNTDISSPVESCLDPLQITNDSTESQKDIVENDIMNLAPGLHQYSSVLGETVQPIIKMKSAIDDFTPNTEESNGLSDGINGVSILSTTFIGKIFGTYKYFYKRRSLAS